jgi:phospholipid/cholesterol/gamma-HCH transport system ATP-binding protein|tara:strand:+ start:11729 stop:12640 length:912 start_codon:yes stop_codon:yes gene_type:complete
MASISGNNPLSGPYSEGKELKQVCMASMTTTQHPSGAANYVEISDLTFMRGDRVIYKDVNIAIPKGKVTAIMGPSGTGKTTLLRLIGGQLKPDQGRIVVDGHNVPDLGRTELFEVRSKMGMLFQSGALFTDLSVYENVAFPLRVHTDLPEDMIRDIVLMKLQAVGLRGASHLMPSELSGGMARRAALARAIALDPELVMYDEPFAGQDPMAMGVVVQLIRLLNDALGHTSIVVSHDVQETASIADYIYVISGGEVIGQGTADEVLNSELPRVRQFMQGLPDGPVPFHFPAPSLEDDFLRGRSL